jgi:hypothetical protein
MDGVASRYPLGPRQPFSGKSGAVHDGPQPFQGASGCPVRVDPLLILHMKGLD